MIKLEYIQNYPEYDADKETTCSLCNITSDETTLYYINELQKIVCATCIMEFLLNREYLEDYEGSELVEKLSDLYFNAFGEEIDFVNNGDKTYTTDSGEELSEKEAIEILINELVAFDFDIDKLEELFPEYTFEEVETDYDMTTGQLDLGEDLTERISDKDYSQSIKGKAYKVFKVKNGKLYPPMVANPGGADTPIGVWLDADEGEFAGLSKTGRMKVKSTGGGTLAYRPGWHLGDLPLAPQFFRTNKETGEKEFPKDFIWAECDYVADIDYQDDAMSYGKTPSGKFQHSLAGLPRVPEGGYYRYRTNPNPDTIPWVITGAMRVNRLLDDYEVADILAKHGKEAPNRQGGNKTLKELGF